MIWILAASLPQLDPDALVRVEVPDLPGAITGSATASVLAAPPPPGTPWRYEPVAVPDGWSDELLLDAVNADLWHADGRTGRGVKVAIFDVGWYAGDADPSEVDAAGSHDCFAHPGCLEPIDPLRPRFAFEEGVHGYGCAEAVRDVAPEAEIHLVRAASLTGFENAAAWAIREDIDVISMSLSFYNDSFYDGSSPVFDRALVNLEAAGVLLVTSAGNNGDKHWSGPFLDTDQDGRMDFDGDNGILVELDGASQVYVNWDQHARCGATDLDARLVGADDGVVYAESVIDQDPDADQCQPIERLSPVWSGDRTYVLEVWHRDGGVVDLDVDVVTRDGHVVDPVRGRSLADPASHPLAFSVGAVRVTGYLDNEPEPFSSWGPNQAGHPKPDIAGPDGLTVAAYGSRGFYGTSASAPVVAGLIALILGEDPNLTSRQAARRLQGWAWGDDATWSDPRWGAGKARLPTTHPLDATCGRRPLMASLFLLPWGLWRRRRSARDGVATAGVPCASVAPRHQGDPR